MRSFRHFLSIFTVFALMSGPALFSQAQDAPDNQQYDDPANTQPVAPDAQPAPDNESAEPDNQPLPEAQPEPEPDYDQQESAQQPPAPTYDDQSEVAQNNQQPPVDPPARAARLQFMTGSVSVQPQGTGDWVTGELNRPLTNSDNIWADKDSRAEISVGSGLIRIGSESSLTLTNIGENVVQVQLHQGALSLHVRRLYDGEKYEVDTPNQAFTVEKPGDYRFDVNPDADKTIITVWRGEGESTGDGSPVRIHANEQVRFSNGTSLNAEVHGAPGPDAFDQWAQQRDEKLDHSQSAKYVSPDMVGGDDLDEYGVWKETPDYGAVWYPSVGPGWAPYYNGHWVYEYPWGWTWVDYEPWGFAPFHYGRWVYGGGGWGWAPGPIYARPYYAPALVAWFGGGVGVGFGWCPLGWGEPFIPWYGVSRGYFYRVNFTNGRFYGRFHDLNGFYGHHFVNGRFGGRGFDYHYANFHRPGGFTMASRTTIVNSRSISRNNIRVSSSAMSRMSAVHSLGVRPTRASIVGSRGGRAAVPPQRAFARPVVSRMSAPNRGAFNRGSFNRGSLNQGSFNRPPVNHGSFNQGSFNRGSANGASRGGFNGAPRPGFNGNVARPSGAVGANRGPTFNNARGSQGASMGGRGVPRPPNAGAMAGRGMSAGNAGRFSPEMNSRGSVPRPPSGSMGRSAGPAYSRGGSPNYSPRSAGPSAPRGGFSAPHQSAPQSRGPRGAMSVPRPSPSVAAANRTYTNQAYNRGNFGGSYGRSSGYEGGRAMGSYGSRSYGSPARPAPSYGGGSYGRAQSYGGGRSAYNGGFGGRAPSYGGSPSHAPSYSGGFGGRSAGSYGGGRSAGSFGGGRSAGSFSGGRSMGSFGGGRSSGGFGGGGHASGGGGGHFGGGGGGHASGGGGGHSGGGGHGGHR